MKRVFFGFLLIMFAFLGTANAEQVAKTSFNANGAYQKTATNGVFIYTPSNGGVYIYDKLGTQVAGNRPSESNTDTINFFDYRDAGDSGVYHLNFGTQGWNSTGYIGINHTSFTDEVTTFTGNKNHPLKSGGAGSMVSFSRYCRTGGRFAVHDGKLIIQNYSLYYNNSQCNPSTGGMFGYDLNDETDHRAEAYTGSVVSSQMVDFTTVDNDYVQIVSDSMVLYKKTSDPDIIYKLECNDFSVCAESLFIDLDITKTNGDPNDPLAINSFKHFLWCESYGCFGGLNVTVGDSTGGVAMNATYQLDSNGQITGINAFENGKWVQKVFADVSDFRIFTLNTIDMSNDGIVFDGDNFGPVIIIDEDLIGTDVDFFYERDSVLYNWGSSYAGIISNENGAGTGGGDTGGGDTGGGDTGGGNGTGTGSINYDDSIFNFDQDGDGEIGILNGEIFIGIGNAIKYFFNKIMEFFGNIKNLIEKLSEAFTSEEKTLSFNFIATANATDNISTYINGNVDETQYQGTVLGKIDSLIKGYIAFFILVIGIAFFIGVNRNKND